MPIASVGGLISGLDTETLINQLMQIEALGQTRLVQRVNSQQTSLTALQGLNSEFASLATKAAELADVAGWSPLTATSSSEHVTATVTSDAPPGTMSFTVGSTARAHQLSFTNSSALDARVTAAGSTTVTLDLLDGTTQTLETGDGSLNGLISAINAPGTGLRASTVRLDDGSHRLRVQATATGAESDFTLTNADGSALLGGATFAAGTDAAITIGTDTVHSSTNAFTGVLTGLDLVIGTGTPAGTVVEVSIARNSEAMVESVKAMVDAANSILSKIGSLTSYDSASGSSGVLAGDSTLRSLRGELLSSVAGGLNGTSLASVGIEVDRYGTVVFDEVKFAEAYAADPAGTAARFTGSSSWAGTGQVELVGTTWRTQPGTYAIEATPTGGTIDGRAATVSAGVLTGVEGTPAAGLAFTVDGTVSGTLTYTQGFAGRLAALAERASDSTVGSITTAIKGTTSNIERMEDDIADWDVRLDLRRQTLTRQYAALEVALGQLQNQSQWLAGQIGSLPSMNSGN